MRASFRQPETNLIAEETARLAEIASYVEFEFVNGPYEPASPWPCERCCAYVFGAAHDCQEAI